MNLCAHLSRDVCLLCRLKHSSGLVHGMRERLLAVNMLAAGNGSESCRCVQMIGRSHDDRIEILSIDHPAKIGAHIRLWVLFLRLSQKNAIDITERREVLIRET